MGSLANETISSTYDGLIKTNDEQPLPASGVRLLQDGSGNNSALSIGQANQGATVTGTLTATAFSGDLTGDVTGDLTGTVLTAAQTNITSVGTLSSLAVSGGLTVDIDTLYVDSANNRVGIGTSSPEAILHINKSNAGGEGGYVYLDNPAASTLSSSVGIRFGTSSGASYSGVYTGDISNIVTNAGTGASALTFGTFDGASSAERMRIDSSGNVGIGTSTVNAPLHIVGKNQTNGTVELTPNAAKGSTASYVHYGTNGDWYIRSASSSGNVNIQDTGGNVGIGTSSPTSKLEVAGSGYVDIAIKDTGEATDQKIWAQQYGSDLGAGTYRLRAVNDTFTSGQNAVIITRTGANVDTHQFLTSGSERMRIDSSGNVGIGTSSPATALHVAGGIRFSSSGADANRWSVYWNGSTGDLIVVNNISDIRAKKDLDYNIKGLETVQKLKPVKFTWKDGTSHSTSVSGRLRQYGFIAQETMEADDYLAWHNQEQDTWGIEQYESFSAVMVKAIQEQQEMINNLKARIETLENK